MGKIKTDETSGWVEVTPENADSSADVYVVTHSSGASLKLAQVRELIEDLAKVAGFPYGPTGSGMGIIIQFPESAAVAERRQYLSGKFFSRLYEELDAERQYAIEFIIDGEKQRGELK